MKINLIIFVSSVQASNQKHEGKAMIKTIESDIRPSIGDVIDDPGFHPGYHNGYEVVKVTINYVKNECYVSLSPMAIDTMELPMSAYIEHLTSHGWRIFSTDCSEQ